jgi:preprotein translocase subunit SecE
MAKGQKSKGPKIAGAESGEPALKPLAGGEASLATREPEPSRGSEPSAEDEASSEDEGEASTGDEFQPGSTERGGGSAVPGDTEGAGDEEAEEGDVAAAQLGTERYVLAAFFAAAMLGAYIFGKLIHGVWSTLANKDWFSRALPALAAVGDEDKLSYGMVIGGIIALMFVLRTYRNPEIRTWSDEVAAELAKVKWPTKKDVTNSTLIVITATAFATVYLALLDRFWAFVTNIVYGDGS